MIQIRDSYRTVAKRYEQIRLKKQKKTGQSVGKVRLTQSSLLLLQPILATTDKYRFPVLDNDTQSPILPEEIRLNSNDEFVSYDIGYYIVADTVQDSTPAISGGMTFWSYAPMELTSAFAVYVKAWMASLEILVNKISRMDKWDMKKHNVTPRTQFKSSSVALPGATQPSQDFTTDGTVPEQPMIVLSGSRKNDLLLTLRGGAIPTGIVGVWTPPTTNTITFTVNKLALIFRGMLAQNASIFQ
jgi:hypothetical protein